MIHIRREKYENKIIGIEYYENALKRLEKKYHNLELNLLQMMKVLLNNFPLRKV